MIDVGFYDRMTKLSTARMCWGLLLPRLQHLISHNYYLSANIQHHELPHDINSYSDKAHAFIFLYTLQNKALSELTEYGDSVFSSLLNQIVNLTVFQKLLKILDNTDLSAFLAYLYKLCVRFLCLTVCMLSNVLTSARDVIAACMHRQRIYIPTYLIRQLTNIKTVQGF